MVSEAGDESVCLDVNKSVFGPDGSRERSNASPPLVNLWNTLNKGLRFPERTSSPFHFHPLRRIGPGGLRRTATALVQRAPWVNPLPHTRQAIRETLRRDKLAL